MCSSTIIGFNGNGCSRGNLRRPPFSCNKLLTSAPAQVEDKALGARIKKAGQIRLFRNRYERRLLIGIQRLQFITDTLLIGIIPQEVIDRAEAIQNIHIVRLQLFGFLPMG